jgi:hypothetical protein
VKQDPSQEFILTQVEGFRTGLGLWIKEDKRMDEKAGLRILDSYSDNWKSKTCTELSRSIQNLAKDI